MAVEDQPIYDKIHMITERSSRSVEPPKTKRPRLEDEGENAIVFTERDAEGILILHNDAVIVTANIIDFSMHRVFIDNKSSIDILYFFLFSSKWGPPQTN